MSAIDRRLRRLEAEAEGLPLTFRVVWDDEDSEPAPGAIRLRWGDDRDEGERMPDDA